MEDTAVLDTLPACDPGAPWHGVLEGELEQTARQSIADILDGLRHPGPEDLYCRVRKQYRPSLGALEPWAALAFAYGARDPEPNGDDDRVDRILDEAHESIAASPKLDLYGGWCGIAWTLDHLTEPDPGDDELLEVDAAVGAFLAAGLPYRYDLIGGLVGLGTYLLSRLPRPTARRGLEDLVRRLAASAEVSAADTTWLTPAHQMGKDLDRDGVYNLGAAHGLPGLLAFLALVHEAGIARDTTRELLESAVPWILRQRLDTADEPCMPRWSAPGESPGPCRIAWCYGDLGVAGTLMNAGRALGRADWHQAALDLARHTARVPFEKSKVLDPGLCHGAIGNAHILNRLYQQSGDAELKQAALFWYERALAYRRPDEGLGGYPSFYPAGDDPGWKSDASFLMGAVGVALALLAAVDDTEPSWDRLLLLS